MRGCLAFFIALAFVACLPLALLAFNVNRVVFDAPLVKRVVTKEVTESDLIAVTLQWLAQKRAQERVLTGEAQTAIREPDALKALQFPDLDAWRKIRALVLPNQFLAQWTATTIDGVYGWIDSTDQIPNIILDFRAWKNQMKSANGHQAIQIVYDSLPACKQADIDDFLKRLAATPPGKEILYNLYTPCMFPAPWRSDQNQDYLDSRDEIMDNAPDIFNLPQELARVDKQAGVGADALKQQLKTIRLLGWAALVVPLGLIALLVLLGVRSQIGIARWLGLPLLVGGLLSLLPTLTYSLVVGSVLTAGPMSEVPKQVTAEFTRAFGVLLAEIFNPMLIESLALMLIGLIVVIVGIARKSVSVPKPSAPPAGPEAL